MVFAFAATTTTTREFSHTRLIILLAIALNTLDFRSNTLEKNNNFKNDLNYCPKCFQPQEEFCEKYLRNITKDISGDITIWQLLTVIPETACKRSNQILTLKSTQEKIFVKHLGNSKEHLSWTLNEKDLQNNFIRNERLNGIQYCPKERIGDLITTLRSYHPTLDEATLWLYLLVNSQPLLMPIMYQMDFAVPKTLAVCGFTLFQEYAGLDLNHFQNKDFRIKLNIAHQMLKAAIKFSNGFKNYRLYITDLTADNMIYDLARNHLTFVDLDTLLIVDSSNVKYKSLTHKHEYIECPGCFAYSPDDISSYNKSDINIFSTCQFLREDLYRDVGHGFLQPIPQNVLKEFPLFIDLLNECVDCSSKSCANRFRVAEDLIILMEFMLQN